MKTKFILTGFAILTLLVGFSSSNFVDFAFADDDKDRIKKELERMEKYREEQKEKQEKYKKEQKEKLNEFKAEQKEKRDEYKKEIKAKEQKIKSNYNLLKNIYNDKFNQLKNELRDQLRELDHAQLTSFDLTEISEDEILALEDKRIQLEKLKLEFREKILDLKTQIRQDMEELKQDYVNHEEERKNKIKAKLNDIRLKYKDRIKEHKYHSFEVILSSYSPTDFQGEDRFITLCHIPPGNPDNAHTIKVGSKAWSGHMRHEDTMGPCGTTVMGEIIDEIADDDDTDENEIEDILEETEYKVRAETLGEQTEVKLELEFVTKTTSHDAIVNEIIENFALNIGEANELLKMQQEDDEELEEKFEIEIENKDGYSEVEVELRFILDSTDPNAILDAIVARSQLDAGLVKIGLENEIGDDEDDDDDDEDDDDEDD